MNYRYTAITDTVLSSHSVVNLFVAEHFLLGLLLFHKKRTREADSIQTFHIPDTYETYFKSYFLDKTLLHI